MSDEHSCHCAHVTIVMTKITLVEKVMAILAAGVIGVMGVLVGQFISRRVSWEAPPASASERMFLDRVNKPDVQQVRP
jgi:hypothetical protein